jgi:hypothetical protein
MGRGGISSEILKNPFLLSGGVFFSKIYQNAYISPGEGGGFCQKPSKNPYIALEEGFLILILSTPVGRGGIFFKNSQNPRQSL